MNIAKPRLAYESVTLGSDDTAAGKTEAVRALCMLVDQPDSLMGWIPLEKLKLVYTNTTDMNPDTSSPIPIKQVPALPPKSPDLIQAIKSPSNGQKFGFVGVMDRATCEKMFKEKAKEQNFVVRESTHRVGDYTLSIQHTGKVHHFPIQFTEDQKYFIGQYKFKNLSHIVSYYQQNALFCDDKKKYVLLGEPLMPTDKHKPPQSK
ncbi:hypothetical protein LSH36_90g05033 [Paralvinella palmiformis]|uniref:SH2 domain-containing protein n=1 Tax=Paralvinella palmiformis TaxID=53620 RepID=A0AAD9K2R6_9ANNE|nr:hypothetical protein LSH36_90g05033 [Paralvinella palmiformis]